MYASTDSFGVSTSSVAVATLSRSGWLILTPQGLSPCKKAPSCAWRTNGLTISRKRCELHLSSNETEARRLSAASSCWAAEDTDTRLERILADYLSPPALSKSTASRLTS